MDLPVNMLMAQNTGIATGNAIVRMDLPVNGLMAQNAGIAMGNAIVRMDLPLNGLTAQKSGGLKELKGNEIQSDSFT
jgi:uncharacterized membrane protein YfbV (UPF0208 family)